MSDPLGVHISAREIYDEIVGMRADLRSLAHASDTATIRQDDHEQRLRDLERWKYALPIAAVMSGGAMAAELIRVMGS